MPRCKQRGPPTQRLTDKYWAMLAAEKLIWGAEGLASVRSLLRVLRDRGGWQSLTINNSTLRYKL